MKKMLSLIISMLVVVGFSVSCSANNDAWKNNTGKIDLTEMSVTGKGIAVDENTVKISAGGDFEVVGECDDGMIYVNTEEKVKLRLSGMSLTNTKGPAVFFDNVDKGFITITENTENFLADGKEYTTEDADAVLFSNDDLEIKGEGKLTVLGNYKHGIVSDDLNIENGIIDINSYEHGLKVNDTLHITGGNISVTTETGKGMKAELEVLIDDGVIDINSFDEGIESKGLLTINDGEFSIVTNEDGINAGSSSSTNDTAETTPKMSEGKRPEGGFGGGFGEFGRVDEETASAHAITINGGNLYIKAAGDGIDSNGNLTINGGQIIIDGPESRDNGSLDSDGAMNITSGTVFAASAGGMMQFPRESEIFISSIRFEETKTSGTEVEIKNPEGIVLFTHSPDANFDNIIFASKELEKDVEYTVYLNGEKVANFTIGEMVQNGGMRPGGMRPGGNREQKDISVSVNGKNVVFDSKPVIKNNSTLVGFRAILEALGAEVEWEGATQTVTATKDDTVIILKIGSYKAIVNGEEYELLVAPEIINDRTMIPVRFMSERLNMEVKWDERRRHITVDAI